MAGRASKLLHCVFVQPKIPGNTGTTGRTCLALDAQLHLVGPLGFSLDDPHVKRSGLDYWPHVQPAYHEDWDACRADLEQRLGVRNFLFFTTHATEDLGSLRLLQGAPFEIPSDLSCACVFGSETAGLLSLLPPDRCANQRLVRLPMLSDCIRSLNLAVSAGIGLWEVFRQQQLLLQEIS